MMHYSILRSHLILVSILISFAATAQSRDIPATPDSISAAFNNNNVVLNWRYNAAQNIDGFIIQRSINGTNSYSTIGTVQANARSYTDASFVNNSVNNYRLRSFKDSLYSYFSNIVSVSIGNAPFAMTNGTFTKCGVTFYDPGGSGNYFSGRYTTTVRPSTVEGKVRISFSEFNVGYGDSLQIYNGSSVSSSLLGSYSGSVLPPDLESTAPGGELTFVFNSNNAYGLPGWKAFITCYKPLDKPTTLRAKADSLNSVQLT